MKNMCLFWGSRLAYNIPQSILRSVTTINLMILSIEQNNHIMSQKKFHYNIKIKEKPFQKIWSKFGNEKNY